LSQRGPENGVIMPATELAAAISGAPLQTLDDLSRDIWRALQAGMLGDADAQALAEAIHARRAQARAGRAPLRQVGPRAWSYFPPKRPQRSPDRQRSLERRRRLAASGPLPPSLAARFTVGELAALRIVVDEVRVSGVCARTLAEIAARAGVSVCTARNAIRMAARLGLVTVEERRRHCRPNLSNIIRIVSREWLAWMSRGGGSKKFEATDRELVSGGRRGGWNAPQSPSGGHRRRFKAERSILREMDG
jgi:hypothetical protein